MLLLEAMSWKDCLVRREADNGFIPDIEKQIVVNGMNKVRDSGGYIQEKLKTRSGIPDLEWGTVRTIQIHKPRLIQKKKTSASFKCFSIGFIVENMDDGISHLPKQDYATGRTT